MYKYLILIFFISFNSAFTRNNDSNKHTLYTYFLGQDNYKTEYYILEGKTDGPKILIDAGIHGDEIAGIYACDTVLKYININKGTLILVPRVNLPAINKNKRTANVDLNHVFPGNRDGNLYEERLAYEFMNLIGELKPDVVINLHEAWTRYDKNLYEKKKDKSFGQTFITNSETPSDFLINVLFDVNGKIDSEDDEFRIQYFPFKSNHSMDNIIAVHNIPSYTVETLRILPLEQRIDYQIICILSFISEAGVIYSY